MPNKKINRRIQDELMAYASKKYPSMVLEKYLESNLGYEGASIEGLDEFASLLNKKLVDTYQLEEELLEKYDQRDAIFNDSSRGTLPFQADNSIMLKNNAGRMTGLVISPNQLDTLAKYGKMAGLSLKEAIGIPLQEDPSILSSNSDVYKKEQMRPYHALRAWSYFRNPVESDLEKSALFRWGDKKSTYGNIGGSFRNLLGYNIGDISYRDAVYDELSERNNYNRKIFEETKGQYDLTPLEWAYDYYKSGKYNTGHQSAFGTSHSDKVIEAGQDALKSKELQEWLRTSPYVYKEGGEVNLGDRIKQGVGVLGLAAALSGVPGNVEDATREGTHVVNMEDGGAFENHDYIYTRLTEEGGIDPVQAVGILANLDVETGGLKNPQIKNSIGAYGIQQWLGPRLQEMQKRYGANPNLEQQVDFLIDEHRGNVKGSGWNYQTKGKVPKAKGFEYYQYGRQEFENAPTAIDAVIAWNQGFGRPKAFELNTDARIRRAEQLARRYGVQDRGSRAYDISGYYGDWDTSKGAFDQRMASIDQGIADKFAQDAIRVVSPYSMFPAYERPNIEVAQTKAEDTVNDREVAEEQTQTSVPVSSKDKAFIAELINSMKLNVKPLSGRV